MMIATMIEVSTDQLKQAIESQHGGSATFVQSVPVHEEHGGQVVWDGSVYVFDLKTQPDGAFRAYAWSHVNKDGNRRFVTILHSPKVFSPVLAVRAAIVADQGATK